MRIIIDLQACQHGTPEQCAAARGFALQLAEQAAGHDVWLAANGHFQHDIAALRQAFLPFVPEEKFFVFEVAAPDGEPGTGRHWLEKAADALRAGAFATRAPDLVLAADFRTEPARHLAQGADPALVRWTSVVRVGDVAAVKAAAQRGVALLAPLAQADLLLADTEQDRAQLAALLPDRTVAMAAPADLWPLLESAAAARATAAAAPPPAHKPRLAYISPLPPEKSGIADYSAELLPELARYYDVDVVLEQPELNAPWVQENLAVRSVAWFEEHADEYAHRLYHFGNSPMHQHMFALLERHPGVVVLHDFYLGNILHRMEDIGYLPNALRDGLFRSHGFGALFDLEREGTAVVWKYPCNKPVLDAATGVIVHSAFPAQLARQWYGPDAAANWHTLPLLRGHPGGDRAALRQAARDRLGLKPEDFLVCSFGLLGPTKLNHRLVDAWLASPLMAEAHARLVFVGELSADAYARELNAKLSARHTEGRIVVTGFVSQEEYQTYLMACDAAVQLRNNTRGETSAAVLDCMLHGLPTVINAHGAMAELPADVLIKLEDQFATADLEAALLDLYRNPARRAHLGELAAAYIATHHAPAQVGAQYHATLERIAQDNPLLHYRRQVRALQELMPPTEPPEDDLLRCARALAANQPARGPRQLLVDVSAMVQTDLRTGIQRVVRSILHALLAEPPAGFIVEPVYSPGNRQPYRYARAWLQRGLVTPVHGLDDAPIELHAGDIFLGLDLMMHGVHTNRALLQSYRNRGVHVHFVVYDLLPVLKPAFFPFGSDKVFADWLDTIGTVSDGIVAISRAVADELADWYEKHPPIRVAPLQLGYFHLGADIEASAPTAGLPADAETLLATLSTRPGFLMVGTLEPRKGHRQVVDAFDLLWRDGQEVNLVIVGKKGWMVDDLAERLENHPELGKRLFWLQGASDELLQKLYQSAACLLAPSEGEGFGLPLIEAAQHQIPIIARALPVFREVAGDHAYYFDGETGTVLAEAVARWLELSAAGTAPHSQDMPWLTWRDSARQLKDTLDGTRPYRSVTF
ncbi:glycosyltransferase [Massilia sp. METH4]|uniref:glycosyltransferase n=1 Tax=Massilia sp. METH4 TaxID=3123041 RepID=UPI0030CBE48B